MNEVKAESRENGVEGEIFFFGEFCFNVGKIDVDLRVIAFAIAM